MADIVANVGLGRFAELAYRVENNDPTNSAFLIVPFSSTATDNTIRDYDTLADVEADPNSAELAANGWNRKTLANGSLTITVNDTSNRIEVDCANQTWTAVTAGVSTDLLVGYDPDTTGGTDSAVVFETWHDFAVTPDGGDITAVITDLFRATSTN